MTMQPTQCQSCKLLEKPLTREEFAVVSASYIFQRFLNFPSHFLPKPFCVLARISRFIQKSNHFDVALNHNRIRWIFRSSRGLFNIFF